MTDSLVRASSSSAINAIAVPSPFAVGILCITMYGMWLHTTGGIKRVREKTRNVDGSETEREVEYYGPAGPLRAALDLLTGSSGGSTSASANGL